MIVHINSYPGVGKFTIGRALAELIGAKFLDNRSVFNVAFALTEFCSPAFYDTVRAVREIAYRRVLELCSPEENERRIVSPGRAAKRKPQDVEMVEDNRLGRPLLDRGADRLLRLDVTNLAPEAAAREIAAWLSDGRR